MSEDARRMLATTLDMLNEVAEQTETLPDKSDICMATMYLNHCMRRLEGDVADD